MRNRNIRKAIPSPQARIREHQAKIANEPEGSPLIAHLAQAGLSTQTDLIAMHLTEIEEEAINFLDQLTVFRAHARHQDFGAAQEALVEISLALQHVADHIQAVTPILDRELDIGDD